MHLAPRLPDRRSHRLPHYDYTTSGAYFVTVCTDGRRCLLGHVADDAMHLCAAGEAVQAVWNSLPSRLPDVELDIVQVMPNHIHAILWIIGSQRPADPGCSADRTGPHGTQARSLGRAVQAFKSLSTNAYIAGVKKDGWPRFEGRLWQRDYFDHVIRNDTALHAIRQYILTNPLRWALDKENPDGTGADDVRLLARTLAQRPADDAPAR